MPKTKTIILCLIWGLLLSFSSLSWAWSGKVVGVADGDTIRVLRDGKQVKIRLYGIDCTEKGRAFGKKAKQFTSKMVFGKVVEVHRMDTDRYGRTVALVAIDKQLLNEELLKAGLAWVYDRYCLEPICESWKHYQLGPSLISGDCGAIPIPYRPGSLGVRKGEEIRSCVVFRIDVLPMRHILGMGNLQYPTAHICLRRQIGQTEVRKGLKLLTIR